MAKTKTKRTVTEKLFILHLHQHIPTTSFKLNRHFEAQRHSTIDSHVDHSVPFIHFFNRAQLIPDHPDILISPEIRMKTNNSNPKRDGRRVVLVYNPFPANNGNHPVIEMERPHRHHLQKIFLSLEIKPERS
ncbi:hypothetical protein CARUB_v10006991mg [Capsella rubella]|uniref:Uncharacterized protein n=1 Tax=Capsella rubella TaxID=81985 RepID=R0H4L3_9BRAS|nr:hypothetical protein CARUB_v10006991mg [Capsella rubella]